jgi:hypothetical protein
MRPRFLIGAAIAAAVVFVIFGFGMHVGARSNYGAGWWGPGMMDGYAMGPGMMGRYGYGMGPWMMGPNAVGNYGYGMGPWMMGPQWNYNQTVLNLSPDDVRSYFEGWLAWQGNPRVKLGNVTEKDADTITADIVTTDKDGLVQRFAVNRHTGISQRSED